MIETQDLTRQMMQCEIESLRQQLAECGVNMQNLNIRLGLEIGRKNEQLAECERERDAYKLKAVIADMPMSEVEARLMKERDELVTALKIACDYAREYEDCPFIEGEAALAKVGADKAGEGS